MQSEPPSLIIELVQRVAAHTGADPLDLPPLYDTIDPDGLETCITRMEGVDVSFEYAGVAVTVESTGAIQIGQESSAASLWSTGDRSVETPD